MTRTLSAFAVALSVLAATLVAAGLPTPAVATTAATASPDDLVRRISTDVLDIARADTAVKAGDIARIRTLVEDKVMPHVHFEVITRSAVGPQWRSATPEQRTRLQAEFKTLLIRVYAGALRELGDQTVHITRTLPVAGSTQVVVQSEVRGKGEPIKLDYRLDRAATPPDAPWQIIDVNVGGLWLVQNYRNQFAQELGKGGIPALIDALSERNKAGGTS